MVFKRFANYRIRGAVLDGIRKSAPLPRRAHARVRALEAALLVTEGAAEDAASPEAQTALADKAVANRKLTEHLADIATAMAVGLLAARAAGDHGELAALGRVVDARGGDGAGAPPDAGGHELDDLPEDEHALVRRHYLEGERFEPMWRPRSALGLHTRAVARLTKRLRLLVALNAPVELAARKLGNSRQAAAEEPIMRISRPAEAIAPYRPDEASPAPLARRPPEEGPSPSPPSCSVPSPGLGAQWSSRQLLPSAAGARGPLGPGALRAWRPPSVARAAAVERHGPSTAAAS